MSTEQYILYDLPSQPPSRCWSHNPWKTRLLLNYKKLDYKTVWVEYPDIKPTFENIIPPHPTGVLYTIPTVRFPDGTTLQDSLAIANKINTLHPSSSASSSSSSSPTPPLPITTPYLTRLESLKSQIMPQLGPEYLDKVARRILNPRSATYFRDTRATRAGGIPIDQLERERGQGRACKLVGPLVSRIGEMLKGNENEYGDDQQQQNSSPFFEGKQVSYADFVWAGTLKMWQRIGEDLLMAVLAECDDPEPHLRLLRACEAWLERDDR